MIKETILIFSNNRRQIIEEVREILCKYNKIENERQSSYDIQFETNKHIIKIVPATEYARGYKASYVLYDIGIDEKIFNNVIKFTALPNGILYSKKALSLIVREDLFYITETCSGFDEYHSSFNLDKVTHSILKCAKNVLRAITEEKYIKSVVIHIDKDSEETPVSIIIEKKDIENNTYKTGNMIVDSILKHPNYNKL